MYRNRVLVISRDGWRIGQCNRYRSSPRVFRTVYDNFHLDRERRVLELSYRFCRPTMSPKNGDFEFSWISRRVRVAFWNCLGLHLHYCATVSDSFQFSCPNMQWLARLDFKNPISAFWLAKLVPGECWPLKTLFLECILQSIPIYIIYII